LEIRPPEAALSLQLERRGLVPLYRVAVYHFLAKRGFLVIVAHDCNAAGDTVIDATTR
jgi:hypothetical protein